jgi:hypothetical protein
VAKPVEAPSPVLIHDLPGRRRPGRWS